MTTSPPSGPISDMISQIEVIAMLSPQDRWEISDLLGRFCIAADTRELSLLDDVLTSDVEGVFQTGTPAGLVSVTPKNAEQLSRHSTPPPNLTHTACTHEPSPSA